MKSHVCLVVVKEAWDCVCGEFVVYVCPGRVRRVYASGVNVRNEKDMGVVSTDTTYGVVQGEDVKVCWVDRCVCGWETDVLEVLVSGSSWLLMGNFCAVGLV